MEKIRYTGTNYAEVQRFCGDKLLAPYFCMGFSMLTLVTEEGLVYVNEGDEIGRKVNGSLCVLK